MLKLEVLGAGLYGGAVTIAAALDKKRIDEGKILKKDIFKKFETWTYLVPGALSITANAMGWLPRQAVWLDQISTGAIYDAPRFVKNLVESFRTETATRSHAVEEAQQILRREQNRQLATAKATGRYPSDVLSKEFANIRLIG